MPILLYDINTELKGKWGSVWSYMKVRKKFVFVEKTEMKRVLTTFDLTLLGIGGMLGMGVYIMSGALAKSVGPAMFISFILAGITCILSAFCYAEFAGRAPGTGSAYAYCYITVGEFTAFLLGWNLVLEFVIGTACLARGLSGYFDSLINNKISTALRSVMPMDLTFFSPFPDFFALLIMFIFSGIVSCGVKESSIINNTVVVINLATIISLIIIGIIFAEPSNWSIKSSSVPSKFDAGTGGFMPFGGGKILEGAATCFYAYTGFDTVATTGNEAKNPSRAIPLALIISLSVALVVYTGISSTFTLMWPYYDQDTAAPFPYILKGIGIPYMKYLVTIGALAAITGSTLASTFGMARIVYSIAYDGLLFGFLGKVNKRTKTPVNACMVSGLFTGLVAVVFDADQLVNMTSLGTLMAYTLVAICILILRYEPTPEVPRTSDVQGAGPTRPQQPPQTPPPPQTPQPVPTGFYSSAYSIQSILNTYGEKRANLMAFDIAVVCISLYSIITFCLNIILAKFDTHILDGDLAAIIPAAILAVAMLIFFIVLQRQPTQDAKLIIKVKPIPLVPLLTIFINTHLMLRLEWETWVRFVVWLVIGLLIYFWYGMNHSVERVQKSEQRT